MKIRARQIAGGTKVSLKKSWNWFCQKEGMARCIVAYCNGYIKGYYNQQRISIAKTS
ncbi:MAG: hypothetical protein WBF33_39285 [Candidatus Nitrosopolaris sp.]